MSKIALVDAFIQVEGFDFTTATNTAKLTPEVETLDATTFGGNGWKEVSGGLKNTVFEASGFWEQDDKAVDAELFGSLSESQQLAFFGAIETETQPCYMWRGTKSQYTALGTVGELAPFSLKLDGADRYGAIRGQLAKTKGPVSATGVLGSVLALGAPATGQRVYAGIQVFSPGTTITVQLQSDTSSGFASPTTQGTFSGITAGGGFFVAVDGPKTGETHWRLNVSAITGTFIVSAVIGVQ